MVIVSSMKKMNKEKKEMLNRIVSFVMLVTVIFVKTPVPEAAVVYDNQINSNEIQQIYDYQGIIDVTEISIRYSPNASKVNVEVRYDVNVTPPMTFYYSTVRNGVRYGGTLNIVSIRYRSDANYALYSGYIYPLE